MGKAFKLGDNVDTDVIIPGAYLSTYDPEILAEHAMEGYDPELSKKIKKDDVFIAGENFGCGSSREQAPVAIYCTGIRCIIAKSFARIFYRNAINIGLPVLEIPEAVDDAEEGDDIVFDLAAGKVRNNTKKKDYKFAPYPDSIREIINAGGLKKLYKKKNSQ